MSITGDVLKCTNFLLCIWIFSKVRDPSWSPCTCLCGPALWRGALAAQRPGGWECHRLDFNLEET